MDENENNQNPFATSSGNNPFAQKAPTEQPPADKPNDALYQEFRNVGLRNFNVDLNDLTEGDEEDLNKIFRSYKAGATVGMSAFEARTISGALEARVPTSQSLLDLRRTSLPQQPQTLEGIASELDQRQKRIDEASGNTSISRDAGAVVGGFTAGVIKGGGGLVDTANSLTGADDFLPGRTVFKSRIKDGTADDTFKDKATRTALRALSALTTGILGKEGNPLLERDTEDTLSQLPTIGRLIVDQGDRLSEYSQSEAGKTYQKEIREAFDSQGPVAAAKLAVSNPLTGFSTFLPESLGFVAGSGGPVGGLRNTTAANSTRVLSGAQKYLQGAARSAQTAAPIAVSTGNNLGYEVEKFYEELTPEQVELLPAFSDFEADLQAAGKDSSPESVRAAMKRSSARTARRIGTVSSGLFMTFIPGGTTIEQAVINQVTKQGSRAVGREVVTDAARQIGREAAERGALRSAARGAVGEGISEALEEGVQSGAESALTQGEIDQAVKDGQFGALIGGLLGAGAGGVIGAAQSVGGDTETEGEDGDGGLETPVDNTPTDPAQQPFEAPEVTAEEQTDPLTETARIVAQQEQDFPDVFEVLNVEQQERVESIYGVRLSPGAVFGVTTRHRKWVLDKSAEIEGAQGIVYPLYSDGTNGVVVDEGGNLYQINPDGDAKPVSPDLKGEYIQQAAYVAAVGTKARLDVANESPQSNNPFYQIRESVRQALEIPVTAALEKTAQTQADPALSIIQTAADSIESLSFEQTYAPLPLPTSPFIPSDIQQDADNNGVVISRAYEINQEIGRSAVRQVAELGIASVGTVRQSAIMLENLGLLNPAESGDIVTEALSLTGPFPAPAGASPLNTVKALVVREEIDRVRQDNELAVSNIDAVEGGLEVDYVAEENVVETEQQTLAQIASGQTTISQPAAVKPATSQDTMRAIPARTVTGPELVMRDNVVPPVPLEAQGVNQVTRDRIAQFNEQWPYEAEVRLYNNAAQYRTAVELGRVSGDVIPIFTDRIKGADPTANIMYGLMQRYKLPELLGDVGSLEFAASLVQQTQVKTSPMGRLAKQVRSEYGTTLSNEEVASEAFARALELGFRDDQVGDAVNYLKAVVSAHGGESLFNGDSDIGGVSDDVFRAIMLNAGSLYRAPVKRNNDGNLVPDPGGLNATDRLVGDDGNYERVKRQVQANPAFGMLAESGIGGTLRRTVGSVFRLRDVRRFVEQSVGSDAFGPIYNAFVLGAQTPPTLAAKDRVALLDPYDKLYTASRKRLGYSKAKMSTEFDKLIKALHIKERNRWMQLQVGQYPSGLKTRAPIPELNIPTGVEVESARALAINAAQQNRITGPVARAVLENLWDTYGTEGTDAQLVGNNETADAIIARAQGTVVGNSTVYDQMVTLYQTGLRPIIDQTNTYRKEAGVNGQGFENLIAGMGFDFYVPLTDEKTSGEANNNLPQFAAGVFSATNRARHTMQGRTTDSQHIHSAIIEMLDLSHHEVADSQLLGRLAEFADTEFAFEQGNGVLRRSTGADILGITFKQEKKGTPADPDFKAGRYVNGKYERPQWRGTLRGSKRNEFAVRSDGRARIMQIADKGTSEAIAARWPITSRGIGANVEVATRTLAASFTTRRPTFWSKQFIRDVTSTPVLIGTEFSSKAGAKTLLNIAGLLSPVRAATQVRYFASNETERAKMREGFKNDKLFKHFDEYVANGGLTLFTEQLELAGGDGQNVGGSDNRPVLQRGIERVTGAPLIRNVLSAMDAVTNSLENMHRLAAFAALRETGVDAENAAVAAREIINFGQNALQIDEQGDGSVSGRQGRGAFRSAFAFARSGVVGADRTLNRAIWKNGQAPVVFQPTNDGTGQLVPQNAGFRNGGDLMRNLNYPMIGLMMAQGAATAAIVGSIASAITGDPDGEEEKLARKIPAHMWASNIIIPTPGGENTHIALPTQLGAYQLFHGIGALSVLVANGDIEYSEAAAATANLFTANTTPFPRYSQDERVDTAAVKTLSPTLIRPVLSIAFNSTDQGSPIRATSRDSAYDASAYTRAFGSTPEQYIGLSRTLRETVGMDVSAEEIRYLFRSYTGDVGNITDRLLRDAQREQDGLERNALTDGLLGGFVPNTNSDRYYPTAEYWDNKKRALKYVTLFNDRVKEDKATGTDTAQQYKKQYPRVDELKLLIGRSDRERSKLNKRRRELRASELPDALRQERLRQVDTEYRQMYLTYARAFKEITAEY